MNCERVTKIKFPDMKKKISYHIHEISTICDENANYYYDERRKILNNAIFMTRNVNFFSFFKIQNPLYKHNKYNNSLDKSASDITIMMMNGGNLV